MACSQTIVGLVAAGIIALDAECTYPMPEPVWKEIAGSNRDRDVALTITAAAEGGTFASSPINVRFSGGRVEGGLYYWSTSLKGTYRLTLGQKKAVPFITPAQDGCYGCHAVSRSGKRIAWTDMSEIETANTVVGPIQSLAQRLATAVTEAPAARAGGKDTPSATMALNPDGSRVLVAEGSKLVLRDAATAAVITTVDPAFLGTRRSVGGFFPEWSPDGKSIALTVGDGVPVPGTLTVGFNVVERRDRGDALQRRPVRARARDRAARSRDAFLPDLVARRAVAGVLLGPRHRGADPRRQHRRHL